MADGVKDNGLTLKGQTLLFSNSSSIFPLLPLHDFLMLLQQYYLVRLVILFF